MGGETERLEREINAYLTGLPGFDLDVYRDIFSSEYVNNVIYNHPGADTQDTAGAGPAGFHPQHPLCADHDL